MNIAATWKLGRDSGYGFGWKFLAGSLTPYYSDWLHVHHYLSTDSTGAEYRLDQQANGIWYSRESVYVRYDPVQKQLYFPDGSFWEFGEEVAGLEEDIGTGPHQNAGYQWQLHRHFVHQDRMSFMISCLLYLCSTPGVFGQMANKVVTQISVCELIARRNEYNGKYVVVRGEVKAGGHGPWLQADSDCNYRLVTRGVEWPNIVFLTFPTSRQGDGEPMVPFRADLDSMENSLRFLRRQNFDSETDRRFETYEGIFVTDEDLERRVSPGLPNALRLWFGPSGLGAPGKLIIRTQRDVTVLKGIKGKRP